ncbi:MAG: hypothetical protein CSA11_03395 [Chloroflexi bacterium]|nr:MAG: hypothetical protein CSA11_03395 [Chloroflexota bacterium]
MEKTAVSPQKKYLIWMLLVLLTAVCLRLFALTAAPPGLTHDEADHGITALSIVKGARHIYFTIGYGREPLFDYATALLMAVTRPTFLGGRLTAVFFSLIMISGMSAWVRRAFDRQTAVFTAASLAVSFWPVMTARQSLRSITLPALFVLAVYLFWRGLTQSENTISHPKAQAQSKKTTPYFLASGFILGLTFYTYIPARILWLIFPVTVVYAVGQNRDLCRRIGLQTLAMLTTALLTALPLLLYLLRHPEAESRIGQLSQPLRAAASGDYTLLGHNIIEGLSIIAMTGDSYWRYNISGQPLLPLPFAVLFLVGLFLASWWISQGLFVNAKRQKQREKKLRNLRLNKKQMPAASFLAVGWLILGVSPVLVTGAQLSTTQAIGMQPVLYLFPALALRQGIRWLSQQNKQRERWAYAALLLLLAGTAVLTSHRYFQVWANHPDVRVEYETTLVTAMQVLNKSGQGTTTAPTTLHAGISTITPHPAHSPAVAEMTLHNPNVTLSWFNGQNSLLLPSSETSTIVYPGFTPLNPALEPYFETAVLDTSLPMRDTDLDKPLNFYQVDRNQMRQQWGSQFLTDKPVFFAENAQFLGYDVHTPTARPGDTFSIATWWEAKRPFADGVLFTQILGNDNTAIAQADYLDVPSDLWQIGDQFIQLHQITLPADMPPGTYPIIIGLYSCPQNCPAEIPPQPIPTSTGANFYTLPMQLTVTNE